MLEMEFTRDGGFLIPCAWIAALQDVPAEELARLEVWPDDCAVELEERAIHISVDGILTDVFPALLPESALAAIFARQGGRSRLRPSASAQRPMAEKVAGRERKYSLPSQ
jgi:hypothetical protein